MTLPSLLDIFLVIILIIPGFIAFMLFKKLGIRENQISDFETTVWSIFLSLFIYTFFTYITGLSDIDSIRDKIFMPDNMLLIIGLAILMGVIGGFSARLLFRKSIKAGTCWDRCFRSAAQVGTYILLYTTDGKEYKGELYWAGLSKSPKEIVIRKPKVILRDSKWRIIDEIEMGSVILFNEKDISRVVFLKDIAGTPEKEKEM